MNTLRTILLAAVAVTGLAASNLPAAADSYDRSFTVTNNSRLDIMNVYATDVGSHSWGPDLLGDYDIISAGDADWVDLPNSQYRRGYCMFDVQIVFEDGYEQNIWNVNLCTATEIVTNERSYRIYD